MLSQVNRTHRDFSFGGIPAERRIQTKTSFYLGRFFVIVIKKMDIFEKIKKLNLPSGEYVVVGSGPMAGIKKTVDL